MAITRLRAYPSEAELAEMYAVPHAHHHYRDHLTRVERTIEHGRAEAANIFGAPWRKNRVTIADLSCGDAAIAHGIRAFFADGGVELFLGDYAPGYAVQGPLEETLSTLPKVDLYVCCETLEHVRHPLYLLKKIRRVTSRLLLSTPVDNFGDTNPEHIWSWSQQDVEELLASAGFIAHHFERLDMKPEGFPYTWGIWRAS